MEGSEDPVVAWSWGSRRLQQTQQPEPVAQSGCQRGHLLLRGQMAGRQSHQLGRSGKDQISVKAEAVLVHVAGLPSTKKNDFLEHFPDTSLRKL